MADEYPKLRMLGAVAILVQCPAVISGQQKICIRVFNRVVATVRAVLPSVRKRMFLAVQRIITNNVVVIVDENVCGRSHALSALEVVHCVPRNAICKRASGRQYGRHLQTWDRGAGFLPDIPMIP